MLPAEASDQTKGTIGSGERGALPNISWQPRTWDLALWLENAPNAKPAGEAQVVGRGRSRPVDRHACYADRRLRLRMIVESWGWSGDIEQSSSAKLVCNRARTPDCHRGSCETAPALGSR